MRVIRVNFGKQNGVARILGVVGEDQATRIIVDCSACSTDWPGAWFRILAKRGSEKAYIAADNLAPDKSGFIHYLVTNVETAFAGYVFFEVQAYTDDGLAKSWKFDTIVSESLGEPDEKPDPPAPAWYEDVKQAAEDAFASEESAKTRAAEAGSSAAASEKAKDAAEEAVKKAESASKQAVEVGESLQGTIDAIQNIDITTQTLPQDAYATAEAELTDESLKIRLGLPRGKDGTAAVFEIVSTETLPSGVNAFVEETEDSTAQHRQFVLHVPEGKSGNDFVVLGIINSVSKLNTDHPVGEAGQAYAVGTPESNQIYIWDTDTQAWKNMGSLQGPAGQKGKDGKTAFEGATEAGYAGTSAAFYSSLSDCFCQSRSVAKIRKKV